MGAWGSGIFENDEALDFIDHFKARKSLPALFKLVRGKRTEGEDESSILACAELIAALHGFASDALDPELDDWAEKTRKKKPVADDLIQKTIEQVSAIRDSSELRELWAETEFLDEWVAVLDHLLSRLDQPPRVADLPPPRRSPMIENSGSGEKLKINQALLTSPTKFSRVIISLAQEYEPAEMEILQKFIDQHEEISFCLSDYPRKKTFKVEPAHLANFKKIKRLELWLETLTSVAPFKDFLNLERITVSKTGKLPALLSELKGLPRLKQLRLYQARPELMAEEAGEFRNFKSLELLQVTVPVSTTFHSDGSVTKVKAEEIWHISSKAAFPGSLRNLEITGAVFESLDSMKDLSSLTALKLNTVFLPPDSTLDLSGWSGLKRLNLMRVENLSHLVLPQGLQGLGLYELETLKDLHPPHLQNLRIMSCNLKNLDRPSTRISAWAPGLAGAVLYQLPLEQIEEITEGLNQIQYAMLNIESGAEDSTVADKVSLSTLTALKSLTIDGLPRRLIKFGLPDSIEELNIGHHFNLQDPASNLTDMKWFEFLKDIPNLKGLTTSSSTNKVIEGLGLKVESGCSGFWAGLQRIENSLEPEE